MLGRAGAKLASNPASSQPLWGKELNPTFVRRPGKEEACLLSLRILRKRLPTPRTPEGKPRAKIHNLGKRRRNFLAKENERDLIYISERRRIVVREGREIKRKEDEGRRRDAKQQRAGAVAMAQKSCLLRTPGLTSNLL